MPAQRGWCGRRLALCFLSLATCHMDANASGVAIDTSLCPDPQFQYPRADLRAVVCTSTSGDAAPGISIGCDKWCKNDANYDGACSNCCGNNVCQGTINVPPCSDPRFPYPRQGMTGLVCTTTQAYADASSTPTVPCSGWCSLDVIPTSINPCGTQLCVPGTTTSTTSVSTSTTSTSTVSTTSHTPTSTTPTETSTTSISTVSKTSTTSSSTVSTSMTSTSTATTSTANHTVKFTMEVAVGSLADAQAMAQSSAVQDSMKQIMADQLSVPRANIEATLTASARRLAVDWAAPMARRLMPTLHCDFSVLVPAGTSPASLGSSVTGLRSQTAHLSHLLALKLDSTSFANTFVSVQHISKPRVVAAGTQTVQTQPTSTGQAQPASDDGVPMTLIVGGAAGGIAVLAVLAAMLCICKRFLAPAPERNNSFHDINDVAEWHFTGKAGNGDVAVVSCPGAADSVTGFDAGRIYSDVRQKDGLAVAVVFVKDNHIAEFWDEWRAALKKFALGKKFIVVLTLQNGDIGHTQKLEVKYLKGCDGTDPDHSLCPFLPNKNKPNFKQCHLVAMTYEEFAMWARLDYSEKKLGQEVIGLQSKYVKRLPSIEDMEAEFLRLVEGKPKPTNCDEM